jgi:biopolymer transport protein ExbD
MRFPRHAKIFRGQLDPAAVASVFFAVLLFLFLYGSHAFIPGVQVRFEELPESPELTPRLLKVKKSGEISYLGKPYSEEEFTAKFKELFKDGALPKRLILEQEPGADARRVQRLIRLGQEMGVAFRPPGNRMELPEFAGFPGSTNPLAVVSINLNGQIFFQHQLIGRDSLQDKLTRLVEDAKSAVTLVVQADREVKYQEIIKLCAIARKAGIQGVSFATLPAPLE